VRLFAYGFLSVVLALFLSEQGLEEKQIGLLLTLTLVGDTAISLWITTHADKLGRRRMLLVGAALMVLAGVVFALTGNFILLLAAAIVGVISPSGNEVGPFLPVEQASLAQLVTGRRRTRVFAWYNLVGSFATALGALAGGWLAQVLQEDGFPPLVSYRLVILIYAALGLVLGVLFVRLSPQTEASISWSGQPAATTDNNLPQITASKNSNHRSNFLGLHRSRPIIMKLAALFALDAFAGGFVILSLVAYWFHTRYGVEPGLLGSIFFGANLLAGISALSAVWVADRIGLVNTMVFTHLPSNILLMLVPLMPTLPLAIALLLLRFSISQMDVPTRQSYVAAVVEPDERSAAAGVTGVARTIGASLAPMFTGLMLGSPALASLPFLISGSLKIVYDIALYRGFRSIKPEEEVKDSASQRIGESPSPDTPNR
jgi:MFS family permease